MVLLFWGLVYFGVFNLVVDWMQCKGSDLFWDVQGVRGFFFIGGCVFAFSVIWGVGTLGSSVRCLVRDKWLCFFQPVGWEDTRTECPYTAEYTLSLCTTQQQPSSKLQASKQSRSESKNTQRECVFFSSSASSATSARCVFRFLLFLVVVSSCK